MSRSLYRILLLILVLSFVISMIPSTTQARNPPVQYTQWKYKFHPSLLAKVWNAPDDEVLTLAVRLQPLPSDIAAKVKGHHDLAVKALKEWARITQEKILPKIRDLGGVVLNRFWIDNVLIVRARLGAFKALAEDGLVVKVMENFKVHILDTHVDHTVKPGQEVESWGIFKIEAPQAWSLGYTGQGIRIAVLDTGVDITHPALQGKMLTLDPTSPYYPGGWMEFDSNGNPVLSEPHDTHGHGTHTSGTALGGDTTNILIGVAPGATLMHGLVLPSGSGTFAQVLAGIQWAVDPFYIDPNTGETVPTGLPAHVISMSLGASNYYGDDLFPGIEAALLANIIVVAAIGNDGPGTTSNPGNIWGVFGVGATDINDQPAPWSSGAVVDWPSPPSEWPFFDTYPSEYIKPDFSAPGVDITSSVPGGGYEAWSGTSMATPHVAGTVALVLQAAGWTDFNVPDTPEKVYMILNQTSVDLGDPGQDTRYGWGRIDAYQAVQVAQTYAKKSGVEGTVYDKVSGTPIPWAQVTVLELNKTVSVNGSGYFRIPLDPGTYHLEFTAWGYVSKTIEVQVKLLNGTIVGYVFNSVTGEPIPNATVEVEELNLTTTTDVNGTFTVSVPPGTYNVTVYKENFYPAWQVVDVGENETTVVVFPLIPKGKGVIKGYVYDNSTGLPLANVTVWIDNGEVVNFTDSTGYYELHVIPGTHTVFAWKPGYTRANTTVTVNINETIWANFTLSPLTPEVVVLGNIKYKTQPHLAQLISSLGYPVSEYLDVDDLLTDWLNGRIYPKVIVVDHFKSNAYSDPSWEELESFLYLTLMFNSTAIFLGTSYAGTTAMHVMYDYSSQLSSLGFPSVVDYHYDYPAPEHVIVDMLMPSHPIFTNVTPDNDTWFYLADPDNSDYADYLMVYFNESVPVVPLALVNDTSNGYFGFGIACWPSPSGARWFYLSSWGESYWMQYIEPGSDGVYSNNTARVLLNAVKIGFTGSLNITTYKSLIPKILDAMNKPVVENDKKLHADIYTYVEVYLDREPYGYVKGQLIGSDGKVLSGATVTVLGTPIQVTTDENGSFMFWLPAGNYTLDLYKDGYAETQVSVTVNVNETTDLGVIVLKVVPRIAVLYDYNGEIKNLIKASLGWYACDYDNIDDLVADLETGFFNAVIHAGFYYAPMPSQDQFMALLNVIDEYKLGAIFLDQWDAAWYYPDLFGYGIRALNQYLHDPVSRTVGDVNEPLYLYITQSHLVFKGYKPGDLVELMYNPQSYGTDYSYFNGFSGDTIGQLVFSGQVQGDAIAWKITDAGARWLLMASFAPEEYQDMQYWTLDAMNILLNGVVWASMKPVNVTLEQAYLHVGDTAILHITGGEANETFNVTLDGTLIGQVVTDENGTATFKFTVPIIPGGEHSVDVVSTDLTRYGSTKLYVLPKIIVSPTSVKAPALVSINATGLFSGQTVSIYLDGNYLSMIQADPLGTITININIPVVASGKHLLMVVDASSGSIMVSTVLTVTSQLDVIEEKIDNLGGNLGSVSSQLSSINAKLESISNDVAVIKTDTGTIKAKIEDLNATLVGLITTKTGEVMAVLNTTKGLILAKLDDLSSMIGSDYNDIVARLTNINQTLQEILNQVSGQATQLQNLQSKVVDLQKDVNNLKQTSASLEKNVSSVAKKAEQASGSSSTATMIGGGALVLSLIALALPFIKK